MANQPPDKQTPDEQRPEQPEPAPVAGEPPDDPWGFPRRPSASEREDVGAPGDEPQRAPAVDAWAPPGPAAAEREDVGPPSDDPQRASAVDAWAPPGPAASERQDVGPPSDDPQRASTVDAWALPPPPSSDVDDRGFSIDEHEPGVDASREADQLGPLAGSPLPDTQQFAERAHEGWQPQAGSASSFDDRWSGYEFGSPLQVRPRPYPDPYGAFGGEADVATAPPMRQRAVGRAVGRGLREVAETIILALLIFLLVRAAVQNFQVEGSSMEPTLTTGWYLLVNKAIYFEVNLNTVHKFLPFVDPGDDPTRYLFRGPRRGDVIVFKALEQPPGGPERDFIKRIIAVPGETVEVHDSKVFVDGKALDEPYIEEPPAYMYERQTVPAGHFFVLGDNRNNSSDSHVWGMLPKENIIGQAWLAYWPWDDLGLIDNTSVEPGSVTSDDAPSKNTSVPQAVAASP